MATTSTRTVTVEFTGDVEATIIHTVQNVLSPAQVVIQQLASGTNVITPPSSAVVPTAITIIPPAGNATAITLKGVSGDTGVLLHLTQPTSLAVGSTTTTFLLVAASTINGVRLIWS